MRPVEHLDVGPLADLQRDHPDRASSRQIHRLGRPTAILVPKLARRPTGDLHLIVFEYALDAMRELDAAPNTFSEKERKWVAKREASSFADLEIATLRIVARNAAANITQAAARLGLSHVGLGQWFERRRGLAR